MCVQEQVTKHDRWMIVCIDFQMTIQLEAFSITASP